MLCCSALSITSFIWFGLIGIIALDFDVRIFVLHLKNLIWFLFWPITYFSWTKTEFNTWEMCALNQFANFRKSIHKILTSTNLYTQILLDQVTRCWITFSRIHYRPFFLLRLPDCLLVFTHFSRSLPISLCLLTPDISPYPIPLVHFGINLYLCQWFR